MFIKNGTPDPTPRENFLKSINKTYRSCHSLNSKESRQVSCIGADDYESEEPPNSTNYSGIVEIQPLKGVYI